MMLCKALCLATLCGCVALHCVFVRPWDYNHVVVLYHVDPGARGGTPTPRPARP